MCNNIFRTEQEMINYRKEEEVRNILSDWGLSDAKIDEIITDDFLNDLPEDEEEIVKTLEFLPIEGGDLTRNQRLIVDCMNKWIYSQTYQEDLNRNRAYINLQVRGLYGERKVDIFNILCIKSEDEITESMIKELIHMNFRHPTSITHYEWSISEDDEKGHFIEIYAQGNISSANDLLDDSSGKKDFTNLPF